MAKDQAYRNAEKRIEQALKSGATKLYLGGLKLTELPESIGKLKQLRELNLSWFFVDEKQQNQLTTLPKSLGQLRQLTKLDLSRNGLIALPESLGQLKQLTELNLSENKLESLPEWIGNLTRLQRLQISGNRISDLPSSLVKLVNLISFELLNRSRKDFEYTVDLDLTPDNPLNLELAKAEEQGLDAIKAYLRAKAIGGEIVLNEAKLILIGEGEVGKTCLMDALLGNEWKEHSTTHGIQINLIKLINPSNKQVITLNGWDFGGQRVYRPTHQLFFSAPAVYLVVWKPREGPQQGFIKEWIQLIKRREPSAKILVVATHGGPQQRQPDIDRQELWDLFGKEMLVDFFFVDSKPDENGNRRGIQELKQAIARVASQLPEVRRSVPKSFSDTRKTLQEKNTPYLRLDEVLAICRENKMDDEIANLFMEISHRLGHITHYENDPILRDIVIIRPDWLATAMSYVLDDELTRKNHGIVSFERLQELWNNSERNPDDRYAPELHLLFLRLMERFDISYKIALPTEAQDAISFWQELKGFINRITKEKPNFQYTSLIGQLVPDNRPEKDLEQVWRSSTPIRNLQQTQICRIVDAQTGQSANAEGLFYQLIVRLHKYSLGRKHFDNSVHWQRGLVLDADYNGRALLRHVDNDIHITVRAAFPEYFLGMLTAEVKYLVESFWEGLHCDVTVPCLNPKPCHGLMEVQKLVESKQKGRNEYPCPICNEWQNINVLLRNAPIATEAISLDILMKEFAQVKDKLDVVNDNSKRILSQIDKNFDDLIRLFTDDAKEGPRLFSLFPIEGNSFNPQTWVREKFRLVLWCEHSRLPLPVLNDGNMQKGVYDLEFEREWFQKAVPYLKFLTGTLSLVLPVMSSTYKAIDDTAFKLAENQLKLGKDVIDAVAKTGTALNEIMGEASSTNLEHGVGIRAENSTLRELHAMLKAKDPGFGGLVRVMNKRQEFLWVHEKFEGEY